MQRPEFLIASLSMFVATVTLAAILILRDLQARGGTAASRRKRKLAELLSRVQSGNEEAAAAYDAAIEYLELAAHPSDARNSVLGSLISRRDLLKYGTGGSVPLSGTERAKLLETLQTFSSI